MQIDKQQGLFAITHNEGDIGDAKSVKLADIVFAEGEEPTDAEAADMVDSIGRVGLLEPPAVKPRGDRYVVLYGRKRVKAMQILGYAKCDVIIREKLNAGDLSVLVLTENGARQTTPLIESEHIRTLKERGMSIEAIAKSIGQNLPWVKSREDLEQLSDELRGIMAAGGMNFNVARAASKLTKKQQAKLYAKATAGLEEGEHPEIGMSDVKSISGTAASKRMFGEPARDLSFRGRLERLMVEMNACTDILTDKYGNQHAKLRRALRSAADEAQRVLAKLVEEPAADEGQEEQIEEVESASGEQGGDEATE